MKDNPAFLERGNSSGQIDPGWGGPTRRTEYLDTTLVSGLGGETRDVGQGLGFRLREGGTG